MLKKLLTGALLSMFLINISIGQMTVVEFDSEEKQTLYQVLIKELRCLVCQNQNLADSNSELAQDLRRKVYEMVTAGQGRKEISDYMVARYGEFVLYRPALSANTIVLWFSPFVFLVLLLIFIVIFMRKQKQLKANNNYSFGQLLQLNLPFFLYFLQHLVFFFGLSMVKVS